MKRALRSVLLVLLLSVAGMGKMDAQSFTVGDLNYFVNSDGTTVTVTGHVDGHSATGSLVIPEIVEYNSSTYSVTTISDYAFYGCSGFNGSLTISDSVTTIGEYTFYNCSGFTGSLTIPNSVTTIGEGAFSNCSGFTGSLTIPNSVTTIGDGAFSWCGFTGSLVIPNSVSTIGGGAFSGCSGFTGDLVIPNSVTTIGSYAFLGCSGFTGSLTISNSVTSIGVNPFAGCSGLEYIEVESGNTVYDSRSNCNAIIKTSSNELVAGCKTTIIPNSVITIGDGAFYECSGLTGSLTIPNSVTAIGDRAFYYCSGLTGSLTIPNSVTAIGDGAFQYCSGFTGSLTIGNSVTTIGGGAFSWCRGFTGSLTIPNSVTTIGAEAFRGCSGFTGSLTIPNSVTTIGAGAFRVCSGFTGSLTIPNSVTSIGNYAFYNCPGFTGSLTIGNSVTTIGDYAFYFCNGFTGSLTIPNSVTSLGNYAFTSCSGFTGSLTIPNSVTSIGNYAFYNCSGLTGSLTIGNSVTTIGNRAFSDCGFTGGLTIPNSVTTIGGGAFSNCSGFTGSLTIPNSVTTIGSSAFSNCSGFTGSLTIGNSVTAIGEGAFSWCSGFTGSLTIPNSVTTIGNYAFNWCTGLTEAILYNTNPPSLRNYAINNTSFLIYVPYESLNAYKIAENWSDYEDRIFPMAYTTISGYGDGEGNYRFIASPLVENTTPTAVDNMITETAYDLYRFDQSEELEWRNYEDSENTQDFMLVNGQGYLYANAEDVNLIFKGTFNEDETKEVDLVYDADASFAGWNLVGNPFPVSAYASRSYYTMNEEGTAIEPNMVSSATAIPACTGVMVMAETEGETVVFSTEAPEAATNQGCLQIELSQAVELVETPTRKQDGPSTGSVTLHDKAIVSFNAGDRLEKFVFNKENAVISIPQGGKELAIACSDKQGEIPLNFKATKNGEYILTIHPEAVELDYLHLIDNLTGADVDLLSPAGTSPSERGLGGVYTFTAKTTDYASRFRLVFNGKEADGPSSGSETFAFVNNGNIIITGVEAGAKLQIVDMTGRVVASCGGHTRCVPTTGMAKGVYVLRLINGDDVKTQKIVIR